LDIASNRIYISRDVIFDETCFPSADLHPNVGRCYSSEVLLLPAPSSLGDSVNLPTINVANPPNVRDDNSGTVIRPDRYGDDFLPVGDTRTRSESRRIFFSTHGYPILYYRYNSRL
jgi:hypothetical protein